MKKFIIAVILVMILDQLIKLVFLKYYPEIVILNKGMVFGLVNSYSALLIIILLVFIIIFALKAQPITRLGLGIVLAGGYLTLQTDCSEGEW